MNLFTPHWNSKLIVLFTVLVFGSCSSDTTKTDLPRSDSSLISAVELFGMNEASYESNERNYAVIDMQEHEAYVKSHISNAVNITCEQISGEAFSADNTSSKKDLETLLGNAGIKTGDEIIIYDDKQNSDACRLWWLLTLFGHEKVSILDGGLSYWKEQGNELTESLPNVKPVAYHFAGKEKKELFAGIDDVKNGLKDKNTLLLDVRSLEEYDGSKLKDGAAFAGNIMDCANLEFKSSLNEGGEKNQCFKDAAALKQMFEEKGITNDKKIIVYCHSGTRSAHTTFVLTQLLGYKNVSNYDGSWMEWSTVNDTLNE